MKQLIPQSKIDEATKEYDKRDRSNEPEGCTNEDYIGFKAGVQFALNEIQPLMIEFANYVLRELWNPTNISESKSTQELLEEFIKSKNE